MSQGLNPFRTSPPSEVPLKQAPLARVIAQLRFAPIAALSQLTFIAPFQEAIRSHYPILRKVRGSEILVGPGGVVSRPAEEAWSFRDHQDIWRVSLAPDSVALETVKYSSRTDFFERLRVVLDALVKTTDPTPAGYDRFGVRYVNRVRGPELDELARLVRPEVLGIAGDVFGEERRFTICESSFAVDENVELRTRWGLLPARATTDPTTIELLDEPSWILDLDMFIGDQPELEVSALVEQGQQFAETIYTLFRWCVTDDFLRAYGGRP